MLIRVKPQQNKQNKAWRTDDIEGIKADETEMVVVVSRLGVLDLGDKYAGARIK